MSQRPVRSLVTAIPLALAVTSALAIGAHAAQAPATDVQLAQTAANEGRVGETVNTAGYTYIQVLSDRGEQWIAVPQVALEPGTMIRFNNGMVMRNYYSKSLKRQFPSVIFTNGLQVLK